MKKLISVALAVVMVVCLTAFGTTYQEMTGRTENGTSKTSENEYFTVITEWNGYRIVYANDTKVKYIIGHMRYSYGIFPLYNADGTLQIYEPTEEAK